MPVRAGAEPFSASGGRVGVLLCHGFTGSPASLRPWAAALAAAGYTVELPLLPGHGTRWQDLQDTRWTDWFGAVEQVLLELTERCDHVFVMGLSMGGALALRLAEVHGSAVSGIVVVNPSIHSGDKRLLALPVMRRLVPAIPGICNDIKRPGQDEVAYDRMPLKALQSLTDLWRVVSADLASIDQPLLVLGSEVDHVVEPTNGRAVIAGVSSSDADYVSLANSFHVATLDNDAPLIFAESISFVRRLAEQSPTSDTAAPASGS
jgi:carboxylesterase